MQSSVSQVIEVLLWWVKSTLYILHGNFVNRHDAESIKIGHNFRIGVMYQKISTVKVVHLNFFK